MSEKERSTPVEQRTGEAGASEPFFKRWARRKADSEAQAKQGAVPAPAEESAAEDPAEDSRAAGEAEALPPGDEDMPPLESLGEDSDYSSFLSPRVSAALRKQALRKLFRSPKFNVISELDDYIDDYRNFPALGDLVTSDMKHAAAVLLKKQLEAEEAAAAEKAARVDDQGGALEAESSEHESPHPATPQDGAAEVAGASETPDETQNLNEDPERDA
jgi:hypothetical protein